MKYIYCLLIALLSVTGYSQSIHNPATIGQDRNQKVWQGLWIPDTCLLGGTIWVPAGAGAGKVLTSDANGYISLQNPTGGGAPGGAFQDIQINDGSGGFYGDAGATYWNGWEHISGAGVGSGWGNVNLTLTNSGSEAGLSLENTGTGGQTWNFISTSNSSGIGGGMLSIGNAVGINYMNFDAPAGIQTIGQSNNNNARLTVNNPASQMEFYSNDPYLMLDGNVRRFQMGDYTFDWYGTWIDVNDDVAAKSITLNAKIGTYIPDGNVGIGTTIPSAKLDILGTDTLLKCSDGNGIHLFANPLDSIYFFGQTDGTLPAQIKNALKIYPLGGGGGTKVVLNNDNEGMFMEYGNTGMKDALGNEFYLNEVDSSFNVYSDKTLLNVIKGNVGIGTSSPQTKLHVVGSLNFTTGNEGVGKVLTSDAVGNADWQIGFLYDSITVDALQIKAGADVDIPSMPAIPGYFWEIERAEVNYAFGTVAFTNTFGIKPSGGQFQASRSLTFTGNTFANMQTATASSGDQQYATNTKMVVGFSGVSATGDGVATIYFTTIRKKL